MSSRKHRKDARYTLRVHLAGMGRGKTHEGVRWCIEEMLASQDSLIILVMVQNTKHVVDIVTNYFMKQSPIHLYPKWQTHLGILEFPNKGKQDGHKIHLYSSQNMNELRGLEFHRTFIDNANECSIVNELILATRLGDCAKVMLTYCPDDIGQVMQNKIAADSSVLVTGEVN